MHERLLIRNYHSKLGELVIEHVFSGVGSATRTNDRERDDMSADAVKIYSTTYLLAI